MKTLNGMTEQTWTLFDKLARDAGNWNGTPLFEGGQKEKGNLVWLKKNELITTFSDEGCVFVSFTSFGIACAKEKGIDLSWINN